MTMEGRALMPAFSIAMTKGEAAAVPDPLRRLGSVYGTRTEMIKMPKT